MRIDTVHGVIEIGNILWGPAIARTRIATEALYLFAQYVFDELGYRRFEWKCHNLNEPSKHAAERLGFTFEGVFRHPYTIDRPLKSGDPAPVLKTSAIRPLMRQWTSKAVFIAREQRQGALLVMSIQISRR